MTLAFTLLLLTLLACGHVPQQSRFPHKALFMLYEQKKKNRTYEQMEYAFDKKMKPLFQRKERHFIILCDGNDGYDLMTMNQQAYQKVDAEFMNRVKTCEQLTQDERNLFNLNYRSDKSPRLFIVEKDGAGGKVYEVWPSLFTKRDLTEGGIF